MVRKIDPIRTCKPWNPVATKRAEPSAESVRSKVVSLYSVHCRYVNVRPNKIPQKIPARRPSISCFIMAWWAQVTDTPDAKRIPVLRSGMANGFNASTPVLGQVIPISSEGIRPIWKNIQKNLEKNITSVVIKTIIPDVSPV